MFRRYTIKVERAPKSEKKRKAEAYFNKYWYYFMPVTFVLLILGASIQNHIDFVLYYKKAYSDVNFINDLQPIILITLILLFFGFLFTWARYSTHKRKINRHKGSSKKQLPSFSHKISNCILILSIVIFATSTATSAIMLRSVDAKAKQTFIAHYFTKGKCSENYYKGSSGDCVHYPSSNPTGATARCRNGIYSYSEHRNGTCSGDGGVARWL